MAWGTKNSYRAQGEERGGGEQPSVRARRRGMTEPESAGVNQEWIRAGRPSEAAAHSDRREGGMSLPGQNAPLLLQDGSRTGGQGRATGKGMKGSRSTVGWSRRKTGCAWGGAVWMDTRWRPSRRRQGRPRVRGTRENCWATPGSFLEERQQRKSGQQHRSPEGCSERERERDASRQPLLAEKLGVAGRQLTALYGAVRQCCVSRRQRSGRGARW